MHACLCAISENIWHFALCHAYFSEKFESVEDENPYEGEMNIQYNLVGEQWLTTMVSEVFSIVFPVRTNTTTTRTQGSKS